MYLMTRKDKLILSIYALFLIFFLFPGLPFAVLFALFLGRFKKNRLLTLFINLSFLGFSFLCITKLTFSSLEKYLHEVTRIHKALFKQTLPVGIDWLFLLKAGLLIGLITALFYWLYEFFTPHWVKKSPHIQENIVRKYKQRIWQKISREPHPASGTLLGVTEENKKYIVTDAELNGHCLLLGATGAGKTTTLLNFVESAAQRGLPAVIVDGKGDSDFVNKVKHLAEKHGRKLYLFSMTKTAVSKHYNPLRHGNYTELKDKLISLTEWTEPHYKMQAERYLQMAVKVLMNAGKTVDLVSVAEEITPKRLEALAKKLPEEASKKVYDTVDEAGNTIAGLLNRVAVFAESEIGELFADTGDENTIDLLKVLEEEAMVLFSLNSLMFTEYSRLLGRLIVIDLKTAAARLLSQKQNIYCIFDEFGVFAGPQVIDLVNKSRAAGFHIILSTQELADLRYDGGNELMEQVLGNTNIKIIHRQDVPSSAELLAALIGTKDDVIVTQQIERAERTGLGTVKREKSFIVHPDEIKRLRVGEAIVVKKFPQFSIRFVKVKS
jgi:type IV secretory pathway TraG/TraD family ATPase VirD4